MESPSRPQRAPRINLLGKPVRKATGSSNQGVMVWALAAVAITCWVVALLAIASLHGWRP